MEVSDPNNIKIYNLSAGKSLPDWLSDRKKRALQKKNVDVRRRIELIQDFDMPAVSNNIKLTPDGQYIITTGTYKPRVKCFDVHQLSIKFERCLDSDVVDLEILSEDYSKLVFLHCDRYIELHSAPGRYYQLRVPKSGRSLKYHFPSAELLVACAGPELYRLNLERGQYMQPFVTNGSDLTACVVNNDTGLILVGTKEGRVEGWDPRSRTKAGILDVALSLPATDTGSKFPSVSALASAAALELAVGTATGQVMLFDIRGNKPYMVKDHMYGLPIKSLTYQPSMNLYLSMDSSVLKIWEQKTGKLFTSIEAKSDFNELCLVENSGLMFIANEAPKILTYYIPSLGPAPRWCAFLDNLTEELEESKGETLYDDYKFITRKELEDLGLGHLLGTPLLRAYMHGFFVDIRLYKKAKALAEPFAFENYKKRKIKEKIDETRGQRVKLVKLPSINKDLALKLKDKPNSTLTSDSRFQGLFTNPDFQIDPNADEYRLINPVLAKPEKKKQMREQLQQFTPVEEEEQLRAQQDSSDESSSEDDEEFKAELKATHKAIRKDQKIRDRQDATMYELREGEEFAGLHKKMAKPNRAPLGERIDDAPGPARQSAREIRFSVKRPVKMKMKQREKDKKHHEERRKLVRSTAALGIKDKPRFWKGKRVS